MDKNGRYNSLGCFERKYARLFKGKNGRVAKPLRLALGALIIQTRYQYSDRELVAQLTENPYYQYFIGLSGYQEEPPVDASTLVLFRKRLSMDVITEANESILDATCAPSDIRYPQDFFLLNEAREKLETIIIHFCKTYGISRPRMYRHQARKNDLALAKAKKIRATIRKQLSYIKRDIKYLENSLEEGYAPSSREITLLLTIDKLYEQQRYLYQNKVHRVENRIVSITQPWIRPIVRGKTKAPVEFGAKFDLSLDENSLGRIEKISYEAYNESTVMMEAIERYKKRTGHYPERVLADQIYCTRKKPWILQTLWNSIVWAKTWKVRFGKTVRQREKTRVPG